MKSKISSQKEDSLTIIFEDLMSRFILNVPESEISTTDRVCFQIEQAYWFYEDFLRESMSNRSEFVNQEGKTLHEAEIRSSLIPAGSVDQVQPNYSDVSLPHMNLKKFVGEMFVRCPLLRDFLHNTSLEQIYSQFIHYKMNVPVCGAILLNQSLDKVLLVRGWNSKGTWTFPKGKMNQGETEMECAQREVWEEIGFDVASLLQPKKYIELYLHGGEQRNRMYIIAGLKEDEAMFCPQTRKEIGDIKWHWIDQLPPHYGKNEKSDSYGDSSRYYMVQKFVPELRNKWLKRLKKISDPTTPKDKRAGKPRNHPKTPRNPGQDILELLNSGSKSTSKITKIKKKPRDTEKDDANNDNSIIASLAAALKNTEMPSSTDSSAEAKHTPKKSPKKSNKKTPIVTKILKKNKS